MVDFFVCEKIILKERMVSVMKIIKRDKIKFGLVVTLKEINGENRIDEFIQRCFFNQWFVEKGDIINKHYNECYLITKNIDISDIKIQKEEVSEVRYFSKDELLKKISNNYEDLTEKTGPWKFLKKILERYV